MNNSIKIKGMFLNCRLLTVFILIYIQVNLTAQTKTNLSDEWPVRSSQFYQGFLTPFEGERLDFLQNLQDQSVALLVRAKDGKTFLEFEGEPMPSSSESHVTFIWEMALAKNTVKTEEHASFDLSINGTKKFEFQPVIASSDPDWSIKYEDGTELAFVKSLIDKKGGDVFGYMFLTVPTNDYEAGKSLRIRITGGNFNSLDWFMAFQNVVKTSSTAQILPALSKQKSGLKQPVEIKYTHLGITTSGKIEMSGKTSNVNIKPGENEFTLFLDPTQTNKPIELSLHIENKKQSFDLVQRPVRKFDVYFLPHSHIDIGFTHLQSEVEAMQWRNFEEGIALSEKTQNYPPEARYKWNVEIMWAVDSYLKHASKSKKKKFIEAVKNGWIGLDALYGSELTGLQRAEELMHITDAANDFERNYGIRTQTAMITDVPGYSWGIVPALAKNGVKYFSIGPNHMPHLANGGYQVGHTFKAWGDIPFYWASPSGKEKVLFWMSSHGYSWFHDWLLGTLDKSGGTPILKFLDDLESEGYPYDIVQLRYTMGDNAGPDQGMPDFIKNWNAKYEYPKFRIATTAEMFDAFEKKYGSQLKTYSGDFSPYWEDGAASSAVETGLNRNTAEKLVQAETMYSLQSPEKFSSQKLAEAWQYVLLFSEHTWGSISSKSDPDGDFAKNQWAVKQSFAEKADSFAQALLADIAPKISNQDRYFQVFNTSSWKRSDLVILPSREITSNTFLQDETGEIIPFQVLQNGSLAFIAKDVPPLGSKKFSFKQGQKKGSSSPLETGKNVLKSKSLTVELADNGTIKSIMVNGDGNNLVDTKSTFGFNEYWYSGLNAENPRRSNNPTFELVENGQVFKEVKITSDGAGANKIIRKIRLVHDLDRIDLENTVDKIKELKDENVRFSFPVNVPNFKTRIDQAFFILSPNENQLKGANKNFYCAQRFVDFSNEKKGIAIANLDVPLVEFGKMQGQDWMKDMIRRPWLKVHEPSSTLFSWVMNNAWFVNYKGFQEGLITSRYRIMPHQKWSDADRKKFGMEQSQPLLVTSISENASAAKSFFQIKGSDDVIATSVKPTRDGKGWILKLMNASDNPSNCSLLFKSQKNIYISDNKEKTGEKTNANLELSGWELIVLRIE